MVYEARELGGGLFERGGLHDAGLVAGFRGDGGVSGEAAGGCEEGGDGGERGGAVGGLYGDGVRERVAE